MPTVDDVYVGRDWPAPPAVVFWIASKARRSRGAQARVLFAEEGVPRLQPGSAAYRAAILAAHGLDQEAFDSWRAELEKRKAAKRAAQPAAQDESSDDGDVLPP